VCCIAVTLNANRHVTGTLRGFDQFMNIVLDQTVDMKAKTDIGMVVSALLPFQSAAAAVRHQCTAAC
jgi:small nuclear ribonucleoprotein (snRNP)-like protein